MKAVRIPALAVYTVAFVLGHSAFGESDDAERLLADGDRLAWLKNWQAAEPFFEKAEEARVSELERAAGGQNAGRQKS